MENKKNILELVATPEQVGERLDKALSFLPEIQSRSRAHKLIEMNLIHINGKTQKPSYIVQKDDNFLVEIPEESNDLVPLDVELDILFEDDDLAVVFKPSGLVVHPAEGHAQDTLVNILLAKVKNLSMGFNEKRPGIVHRLDKETSGLLVVAKNDSVHTSLSQQFKERSVKREYYALVYGRPKKNAQKIESLLARDSKHRKRFASHSTMGKHAVTHYSVHREHAQNITELRIRLETGRTHQIRVHLSELGHPIVGDSLYGSEGRAKQLKSVNLRKEILNLHRIALHAALLGFIHPTTKKEMIFRREWPNDLNPIFDLLC